MARHLPVERRGSSDDVFGQLRRILHFEHQRGCADNAVIGGLGGFLTNWLGRVPVSSQSTAARLIAPLADYADLTSSARAAAIDAVLSELGKASAMAAPTVPAGSTSDLSSGERTASPAERDAIKPSSAPTSSLGRASAAPSSSPKQTRSSRVRSQAVPFVAADDGDSLGASVRSLRGVGPAQAARLQKLGIVTIRDLFYHFPRHHLDYRAAKLIRDLAFEGYETILASVWRTKVEPRPGGLLIIRVILADESGTAETVWIRRKDYVSQELTPGRTIVMSGECRLVGGRPVFKDPEWEFYSGEDTVHTARLVPVYPLVEGLNGRFMRRLLKQTLDRYGPNLVDYLPLKLRQTYRLMDLPQAIAQAHYPDSDELKASSNRRLAFDELLLIQLGLLQRRRAWEVGIVAPRLVEGATQVEAFLDQLPFHLTGAQSRALLAVQERVREERPMSLLLEGDVGSGKTVVAAAAAVQAAANGYQSAIMAPTEILAEQHYRTLERLFSGLADAAPLVTLLTGSVKGAERKRRNSLIADGTASIVVGTQALVQEGVVFARLGLVVIDEQHRFGVEQRSVLRQKGYNPHVLVMTATPIPRTLALTLYGDLDLEILDERPPGRQPIKTRYLRPTDRPKAYEFLRREVEAGRQAFVIYPLVEQSERSEARAAVDEYERLQQEVFPDLTLGLLHGRMRPNEKEQVMRRFQQRELNVLVSTAVVEVGIDVPNATVMLIEGANRFGLAQLHQFRGRVGRGGAQSYCLLISDSPSVTSDQRLALLEQTDDGFKLAEADLEMRGAGEFFGTRQSGLPDLKMARLTDVAVLEKVRSAADDLYRADPMLEAPENRKLGHMVKQFWQRQVDLA